MYEQRSEIRGIAEERIDRGTFTFTRGSVGTTTGCPQRIVPLAMVVLRTSLSLSLLLDDIVAEREALTFARS